MLKVFLVGPERVGKSQLLNRFCNGRPFQGNYTPTANADFSGTRVELKSKEKVILQIWDYPGASKAKKRYKYYENTHCCVLVCDMMRKASLEALTRMKKAFLVANAQNESSMGFVLLVNKAEVGNKTKQQVFPEDVVEWCEANGVDLFFETSAAVDTNIVPALVQIAQLAKDMDMARKGIVVPRRTNLHAADTAPSPELQQELTADQLLQKEQDDFFAGMSYDNTAAAVEAAAAAAAADTAGAAAAAAGEGGQMQQQQEEEQQQEGAGPDASFVTALVESAVTAEEKAESRALQAKEAAMKKQLMAVDTHSSSADAADSTASETRMRANEEEERNRVLLEQTAARLAKEKEEEEREKAQKAREAEAFEQLAAHVLFSPEDLQKFKTFFLYYCEMGLAEFLEVLKLFRQPRWTAIGTRLFAVFDRRQCGNLTFNDFVVGLSTWVNGSVRDRARVLFWVMCDDLVPLIKSDSKLHPSAASPRKDRVSAFDPMAPKQQTRAVVDLTPETDNYSCFDSSRAALVNNRSLSQAQAVQELSKLVLQMTQQSRLAALLMREGQTTDQIRSKVSPYVAKTSKLFFVDLLERSNGQGDVTEQVFVEGVVDHPFLLAPFAFKEKAAR